jgi:TetR/AcrR family transcriptional regulator, repressor of fatR-cypB operon
MRAIARSGLHNTPMSAIAREAGVAAGTAYVYFPSKEALINALYLELVQERDRAIREAVDPTHPGREQLWCAWSSFTRWHLEHADASSFINQCESSGILTEETRARQLELRAEGVEGFLAGVRQGLLRDLPVEVFHALFTGPAFALVHMRAKRELEINDGLLRLTFEGVCRSLLPDRA